MPTSEVTPPPQLPRGHPDPATISDVLEGTFQCAYVTGDIALAEARVIDELGGEVYQRFEPEMDVTVGEERHTVALKVAFARLGGREIELIEPLEDPTTVFTAMMSDDPAGVRFHHYGVIVSDRVKVREVLRAAGGDFVYTGSRPEAAFDFIDLRPQLGHYVETIQLST